MRVLCGDVKQSSWSRSFRKWSRNCSQSFSHHAKMSFIHVLSDIETLGWMLGGARFLKKAMYSTYRVNLKGTMKNKGRSTAVSDTKGKARRHLAVTGPLRSVFLISKISMTGNLGTITGKSQTCDFPFSPIALPLPWYTGWPMRMVASHSLNQSYWRKCSALHRCLKVHLPPSQHSLCTLWGQERFILFISSSDKEATSSEHRGQRNSLALLSFLLLLKPEPLFISLYYKLSSKSWFLSGTWQPAFPLIFHFFKSHFKSSRMKSQRQ